ncbi:oligo-1,6-glucosidase [Paenibacillus castaneae]|uniref:glycoside hydrolase family 13 protein n=1 Tax=Paenibacillus castaneae TaxID=474957 RepID=UPI000C9B95A5|nr:alpha-glucosidase [Paenibacillus castaneae]NIK80313.1 oligo-1,6-glucosidase [Paenibacillus castaneae]
MDGKISWWKESVVYQVYWRSFRDSNGDGIGDLQGVIEKLDYIQSLGVTMLWINPFNVSPDKDNGYDVSDYYAVMEKAGTMADFDLLLAETHARGMKLMMDVVVNHTSNEHPWFKESRSSRNNPKRDWYIWHDGKAGNPANPPTNWRSYFNPSCWEQDEATEQYYMHSFAIEQPDLNWANSEVRNEIYQMLRFWLDKGVDGLRLDALALLAKPEHFTDAEDPFDIRYLTHNPGLHDYLQEMNREVFRHYDMMTVGEIAFATPTTGVLFVDEQREELNTLFHFEVADEMPVWDMARFKRIQKQWAEALNGRGFGSQFLNNHDHTRQVTRYGNDKTYRVESAKLLATMIHTLPGIPYIYQGEEIGMTGVNYETIEEYQDIAMINRYEEEVGNGKEPLDVLRSLQPLSRDNSRSPMQWNADINAGFGSGTPWIKVNPNYNEINVELAERDPHSVLAFYRKLIQLRKSNPVMVYGNFTDISEDDPHLYVYVREYEETEWIVLLNHGESSRSFEISESVFGGKQLELKLVLGSYEDTATQWNDGSQIELKPYEARIYEVVS